jgi:hypothetical protein
MAVLEILFAAPGSFVAMNSMIPTAPKIILLGYFGGSVLT